MGFFFCKYCVFIGTYTLQSQQVYSCSLLVCLWHTVHNVTASRDESLREWEMLLSKMYSAILSPFSSVLNESGADGERGDLKHIHVPSYCGCLGCSVIFFPAGSLQEVHVVVTREASLCLETVCY
jgi:hypothetical protein